MEQKTLHAYQSRLIRLMHGAFAAGERKIALVSPTGSGKSLMVTVLLERLRLEGKFSGAVVCVPMNHIKDSFGNGGQVRDVGEDEMPKRPRMTDTTSTCAVDLATRTVQRFGDQLEGFGGRFAYVCTHSTVARAEAVAMVKASGDLSDMVLVVDEGHHSTNDKQANQISRLRDAWLDQGGAVLLATATPYRADGTSVIDDDWFRVQRSLAEQCAEGFAPEHLECRHRPIAAKARSRKEYEDGGKLSAAVVKAIVHDWSVTDVNARGHRPKSIVIVPQMDSQNWTRSLTKALRKAGARVFDATGVDKKVAVREALAREGTVRRWEDSEFDVMIGCKRFDEGTDWPMCSHIYVVGYPASIGTTVQRWGRATRLKRGIRGHQFPDVASITFYVQGYSKALGEDLAGHGRLSIHREASHLIAAHMHDWQTGQQYAKAYRGIFSVMRQRSRTPRERAAADAVEQALAMTETETARAVADIDQAVAKLKLTSGKPIKGPDLKAVVDAVARRHGEDRAGAVAQVLFDRSQAKTGAKENALARHTAGLRFGSQPQSIVRREMRAKFRAIIESLDLVYQDAGTSHRLADVARFNGERVLELVERMRADANRTSPQTLEQISERIRRWYEANGGRPSCAMSTEWRAAETWLRSNHGTTLARLCTDIGIPGRDYGRTREQLQEELNAYKDVVGRYPKAKDGPQWARWASWCAQRGESLSDFTGLGRKTWTSGRSEEQLREEIRLFERANGRAPTQKDGSVWVGWATWCRNNGVSWRDVTGRPREHKTVDLYRSEVDNFVAEHGRLPKSGESRRWMAWAKWLATRGLRWPDVVRQQEARLPTIEIAEGGRWQDSKLCNTDRVRLFFAANPDVEIPTARLAEELGEEPKKLDPILAHEAYVGRLQRVARATYTLAEPYTRQPAPRRTLDTITHEIQAFIREHGRRPALRDSVHWNSSNAYLQKRGTSLKKLGDELAQAMSGDEPNVPLSTRVLAEFEKDPAIVMTAEDLKTRGVAEDKGPLMHALKRLCRGTGQLERVRRGHYRLRRRVSRCGPLDRTHQGALTAAVPGRRAGR